MRKFKTESKKLLDLMINSIYTNREIFLRELISNASDAVDKLYFRSLTDSSVAVNRGDLAITVGFDKEARTVTVSDNGIGMTKDELDKNLGTIAHSDSYEFKAERAQQVVEGDAPEDGADVKGLDDLTDVDIIGQFGVGFYAAFMVGKKVRVVSRAVGSDEAWAWESNGVDGYDIKPAERDEHGTDVIVYLKDNTDEESFDTFATEQGLTSLIKRYSNYVRYPIQMEVTRSRKVEQEESAEGQPQWETYTEIATINSMIPIWKRRKSEVSQEEYNEFYKTDFHDFEDPARTISVHAEGSLNYDALLFMPGRAPWDLYSKDFKKGLALYSSNVLIMEKCEELLPDYFSFVRGVVDSSDLTLNISRETLQHNGQLRAIARRLEKKIKSDLASFRDDDREGYEKFFEQFGRTLKFGIYQSYGMAKDVLGDLLLFYSAKQKKLITLDEYLADAPAGADSIFYAAGDSLERLAQMPLVTTVLAKGYDVLLCDQDVDEFCMMAMGTYGEHAVDGDEDNQQPYFIKNVGAEDLGLTTDEEKKQAEEATESNAALFDVMREALDGRAERVVVSTRLTDAPAVITSEGGVSLQMVQVLKSQPGSEQLPDLHLVLELNDKHPVFATLQAAHEAGDDDKVRTYAGILFDQAMLVEGILPDNPLAFAQAVADLMK
ncbi:molecular chaperone HtpG [Adlercreutzia equolifaciens]|uniref:molecular chaperone HtpG n=1 Tax=Adlercreutzia equolifaciens TaxID=446660 RepID=UPI0023B13EB0|nr:molecular chaperone HtpG [Adlercreutzia equolifaciens]MDE8703497.1 molecular chaperone HtpG [Adlercreutzia equolifaciens]